MTPIPVNDSLVLNSKVIKIRLVTVLRGEAGIGEVSALVVPFPQATIVEHFEIVLDDKGNNMIVTAFLEQNKMPDTSISILKGMNPLKSYMGIKEIA